MPSYAYTGAWPRLFFGLSYDQVTVTRADTAAPVGAPRATVELWPGDVLETTAPVAHAFLTEVPAPAPTPPAPAPAQPAPAPAAAVPQPTPTASPAPAEETTK